jgi:hypothetical protein
MDGIVLYPKTKDEFELIKQFAEERKIGSFFIPQEELEFLERKKLLQLDTVVLLHGMTTMKLLQVQLQQMQFLPMK